jgi:hypothetical protein
VPVEVALDGDNGAAVGWLLPDDLEPVTLNEHWVALLPVLDPTVMGWRQRLLPRPTRTFVVRYCRQRRHHRLGRWKGGGGLGPK